MIASHVKWVDIDGLIYILDLRQQAYFAVEPARRDEWVEISCADSPGAVADTLGLLGAARRNGWLIESSEDPIEVDRVPIKLLRLLHGLSAVLSGWACLHYVSGTLKRERFYPFYRTLSQLLVDSEFDQSPHHSERVKAQFLAAERLFLSRRGIDDCLPRSLALFLYATVCCRVPVVHHIGVQRYPFKAHAWVTVDGEPLLDLKTRVEGFAELTAIGPAAWSNSR